MVELSTRNREIRGDGGNHHEKLGLERISCGSQFTIPDMVGTSPNLGGNNTNTRCSKPNRASCTPDFSGPLVSSISFSSSSPISLFLVHNSTIISRTHSYVIPLYLSMPSSWVNTKCSIHRRLSVIPSFSWFRVDPWMQLQLPPYLPTDPLPPASSP